MYRYWVWVQEMSVFTQSSRAGILEVMNHMKFSCSLNSSGQCIDPGTGLQYMCDAPVVFGQTNCKVDGREIIYVTQGIGHNVSYWEYFGFVCCIFFAFKLGVLILNIVPWERMMFFFTNLNDKKTHEEHIVELSTKRLDYKESKKLKASASQTQLTLQIEEDTPIVEKQGLPGTVTSFSLSNASLTWTNLRVVLPKKKQGGVLIDSVSGIVSSGRILALMGPSGAGKTTLLNALARRAKYAKVTGSIKYAGRTMTAADLTYVPQFDEVNGTLTVQEHLLLVGHLTCVDIESMKKRADVLLDVLGLTDKKDTQVKNLSGGEVKRVSIGIGMISAPYVLFLDEPTTGLDSTAAFSIVKYLAVVAKTTNVAVIMTIHQPSALVFEMLDDLLLLENGRTIYAGSIKDAADYFSSIGYENPDGINPADYYLELAQKSPKTDQSITWRDVFEKSKYYTKFLNEMHNTIISKVSKPSAVQPSAFTRFGYVFKYFMSYFLVERGFYVNRLLALIIIGVFIGTLFLNLQPQTDKITLYAGAMFFTVVACMLTAVSSTSIFAKNRYEAVDRVANGIFTPGVFVGAQFLASSIYNLGVSFVFICIFHWLVNLNPNGECFIYDIFINWGHLMLIEAALLTILEVLKNDFLSCTSAMIFIGSNMSFAGFFRRIADIPIWIRWMCYIVPLKVTTYF
jgi:ABC-type multidrug transport system ATPase subunit